MGGQSGEGGEVGRAEGAVCERVWELKVFLVVPTLTPVLKSLGITSFADQLRPDAKADTDTDTDTDTDIP